MSIKSEWKKVETWWKRIWHSIVINDPNEGTGYEWPWGATKKASWPSVAKASCWEGSNAQVRHMNLLSPRLDDNTVAKRLDWAQQRGCNCVHLFVANQGDGEGAGYSIYGTGEPTPGTINDKTVKMMKQRMEGAINRGLAVAVWLLADDSSRWNKILLNNPVAYAHDLMRSGILDYASMVVLGLELDEYASEGQVAALEGAVRAVWSGKIGVHHTSGKAPFASHGDVVFWQVNPGKSAGQIESTVLGARKSTGKPVVMFECERHPARELCEAALSAGAVGVGNW